MARAWVVLFVAVLLCCACSISGQPTSPLNVADQGWQDAGRVEIGDGFPDVRVAAPDPGSKRGNALAAVEAGSGFVLYSLIPRDYPVAQESEHPYGSAEYDVEMKRYLADWNAEKLKSCADERCLFMNPVLGKVAVAEPARVETLKSILIDALGREPDVAAACIAEYRHAVSFMSGGRRFDVLLCYGCGQVSVAIDGNIGHDDQAWHLGGEQELDAMLTAAGIPLSPKPDI